jgi:hypothetical protein
MKGSRGSSLTCLTLRTVCPEIREGVLTGDGGFREIQPAGVDGEGGVCGSGNGVLTAEGRSSSVPARSPSRDEGERRIFSHRPDAEGGVPEMGSGALIGQVRFREVRLAVLNGPKW